MVKWFRKSSPDKRNRERLKDDARSIAISVCIHVVVLLALSLVILQRLMAPTAKVTFGSGIEFLPEAPAMQHVAGTDPLPHPRIPEEPSRLNLLTPTLSSIGEMGDAAGGTAPSIEFFGAKAFGTRFVFVLDISTTMNSREGDRFRRAHDELLRSVSQLSAEQSYFVYLFNWETQPLFADRSRTFVTADSGHLDRLRNWLSGIRLGGGTDPRRALADAHSMRPDAIFLLSDGHFNQPPAPIAGEGWSQESGIQAGVDVLSGLTHSGWNVPVHTIVYENPFTFRVMQQIADSTEGTCRYVRTRTLEPMDSTDLIKGLRQAHRRQRRHPVQLEPRYSMRIEYARSLIEDGELAFAEYLVRPTRGFDFRSEFHKRLAEEIFAILDRELGDVRVEDFESVSLVALEKEAVEYLPAR